MRVLLGLGFVVALVTGLFASAPVRLVYDGLASAGVEAGLVQGTVWNGNALRVRAGHTTVHQVRTHLSPLSLVSGRPRVMIDVVDPDIMFTGELGLGGEGVQVRNVEGVASIPVVPGLSGFALLNEGVVQFDAVRISLDRDGRCLDADGRVMSPALADAGARYDMDLPILDMTLFCAGEDLALNLSGQSPTVDVEGVIRLDAREPRYRVIATPHDPEGGQVLSLLGFQADGARWIADSDFMEEG